MRTVFAFLVGLLLASPAHADFVFDNLSKEDRETVIEELGALQAHTSVSPASTLGDIFGFEIGLLGAIAKTDGISDIVKRSESGQDADTVPIGGILGALSLPAGFKFEAVILPAITLDDGEIEQKSLALQWTVSALISMPFDLAVKMFKTDSELHFDQVILGNPGAIDLTTEISGFQLLASKKFAVLEPYVGIGTVEVDGTIYMSDEKFSDSNSSSEAATADGTMFFAGANLNLWVLKAGLEFGKVMSTTKAALKLSLYF